MTKQSLLGFSTSVYDNTNVDGEIIKEDTKNMTRILIQANFTKWVSQSKAKLVFLSNPWSRLRYRVGI